MRQPTPFTLAFGACIHQSRQEGNWQCPRGANMACPTCTATMQNIGLTSDEGRAWWCPRCGTLEVDGVGAANAGVPVLIGRVRDLRDEMPNFSKQDRELWQRLGIFEAIWRQEERA